MRILSVHNKYLIRGGEDESRESEEKLMRGNGHAVTVYEEDNKKLADMGSAQIATNMIWSTESYRQVQQQLDTKEHDVVHVQNFFPLISPSVYYAAQSRGVPVVQTLRNYRLLCPNALFFREGSVCEDCLGKAIPYPGIVHGCYRESRVASAGTTAMIAAHRALKTWDKAVTLYITLTEFSRQKFIKGGLDPDKIVVKPNFIYPAPTVGAGKGDYALFVGRLSVEKGIDTLLSAWESLHEQIPLKIVGDGPLSEAVSDAADRLSNVEWLGRQPMETVHELMGDAKCLVFPSKWYETFGRVAVEAFAKGTPVVAANIGAIAELVTAGKTGYHFQPGDPGSLTSQIKKLLAQPERLAQMRLAARAEFEAYYTPQQNYRQLKNIYDRAIERVYQQTYSPVSAFYI